MTVSLSRERRHSATIASRVVIALVARPEQAVGNKLAHARAKAGIERLPGELLRFLHGFGDIQAVGNGGGDRRSQGAAGAVVGVGQALPSVAAHLTALVVESIDHLRC